MTNPGEPWPVLRQELSITKGPVTGHGAPTYTIHDPVGHRFFRLGWLEMEILSRWSMSDPEAIAKDITDKTTLHPTAEDVQKVVMFVKNNGLNIPQGRAGTGWLKNMAARQKVSPLMFLVKNYLFLRVPLFKPDRFLNQTLPLVRPLFSRKALFIISLLAVLGLVMVLRNASFFRRDLETLFSIQGAIMVLLAMGISKAAHELGHAYAAKLLGLRVPSIGIALMCFYPLLWTDTTEAWKCRRRGDRLLIGLSGVGAELALAALASLAWLWLPPGLMRDMALTLAGVTWISTLAINANPFMRYDAYYILSDLFEMPMLQTRAFAVGKWYLRKKVIGVDKEPPEPMSSKAVAMCVIYSWCTWIYRFFLFLGIAFLVYHMFFKALGIVLFLVEIIWFLGWPIVKEIREWYRLRTEAHLTPWGALLLFVVISCFIPWRSSVVAPAILDSEKTYTFHSPAGALLESQLPAVGDKVRPGEIILQLAAPDIDFQLKSRALARRALEIQTANAGLATELWRDYGAQREELAGVIAEEAALNASRDRMVFIAPFYGEVREVALDVTPGQWVAAKEPLVYLIGGKAVVEVMVPEEDLLRLSPGDQGVFLPNSVQSGGPYKIKVISISPGTVAEINKPALASVKGGPLPSRQGPQGQLWPEKAVYLARCEVEGMASPPAALTGMANLHGRRQSLAGRALSYVGVAAVRESGF
ncbi:hypothetical protein C4J81_15080 [Deltaproteobacteria bacterium Smac51]|nr:hypothetical protein C4J81_15080 [Deltaproteobacteria bacterium Smac51]